MTASIFVWGLTFVSTKVLLVDLSPLWILLLRFVLGTIILCLLRPHVLKLEARKDELLFMAAGVFLSVASQRRATRPLRRPRGRFYGESSS